MEVQSDISHGHLGRIIKIFTNANERTAQGLLEKCIQEAMQPVFIDPENCARRGKDWDYAEKLALIEMRPINRPYNGIVRRINLASKLPITDPSYLDYGQRKARRRYYKQLKLASDARAKRQQLQ